MTINHTTPTQRSFDLVTAYVDARARGDKPEALHACDEIFHWLEASDTPDDAALRLLGLVMTLAQRCATQLPPKKWQGVVANGLPIDAQPPPVRMAMRLVLAYSADNEQAAVDMLCGVLELSTMDSLADELAAVFVVLSQLHLIAARSKGC